MTINYRLTEVNSNESHPEAFDDANKIARVFERVEGAANVIKNTRLFIGNADIRQVIPTVVDRLSQALEDTVINSEVASQVMDVEPKQTLSPEALEYLRQNSNAASVHSLNQVILDDNHALVEGVLDEEQVAQVASDVSKLGSLLYEANDIYNAITSFGVEEDYDDEDDWDEDEDDEDDWDDWDEDEDDEDRRWF